MQELSTKWLLATLYEPYYNGSCDARAQKASVVLQ